MGKLSSGFLSFFVERKQFDLRYYCSNLGRICSFAFWKIWRYQKDISCPPPQIFRPTYGPVICRLFGIFVTFFGDTAAFSRIFCVSRLLRLISWCWLGTFPIESQKKVQCCYRKARLSIHLLTLIYLINEESRLLFSRIFYYPSPHLPNTVCWNSVLGGHFLGTMM